MTKLEIKYKGKEFTGIKCDSGYSIIFIEHKDKKTPWTEEIDQYHPNYNVISFCLDISDHHEDRIEIGVIQEIKSDDKITVKNVLLYNGNSKIKRFAKKYNITLEYIGSDTYQIID